MEGKDKNWITHSYLFVLFIATVTSLYILYYKHFIVPITERNGYTPCNLITGSLLIVFGAILSWILFRKLEFLVFPFFLSFRRSLTPAEAMGNSPMSCCKSPTHQEGEIYYSPGDSPEEAHANHQKVLTQLKKTDPEEYGVDKINAIHETSKYVGIGAAGAYAQMTGDGFNSLVAPLSPSTKVVLAAAGGIASYKAYEFVEKEMEAHRDSKIADHRQKYEKKEEGFGNNDEELKENDE